MTSKPQPSIVPPGRIATLFRDGPTAWMSVLTTGVVILGLTAAESVLQAADGEAKPSNDVARRFFAQHCRGCHADSEPKGDFRLESLTQDFADRENRERWLAVLEQVGSDAMPPDGRPRPAGKDVRALVDSVRARVAAAEQAQRASGGRVVLRRLNRNEYANTVRDLLAVDVELKDLLPQDATTSGFDNSAEALHISSYLMENYLAAADRVLDAAIANGPRPNTVKRRYDIKNEKTVKPTGSVYRHLDDGVAIFSSWVSANIQVTLWQFQTRRPGRYRFRISGYGFQTKRPLTFHVKAGPLNAAAQQYLIDYFEVPAEKPSVVEFVEKMEGRQTIRIVTDGLGAIPPDVTRVGAENYQGPGLVVQWVDVEGPLVDSWPPASHRLLFGDLPRMPVADDRGRLEVVSEQPLVDAERILRDFARRAFRRSVTDDDIAPFLARVREKLEQGYTFEQALRVGLKGVLVSPYFLFLREKTVAPARESPEEVTAQPAGVTALDDFSLASRLSYFLWSSMPDEQLLELAARRELRRPETLRRQVERMLDDPKAAAFTENFAGQWLGLRAIDDTTPDRKLYPEYDDVLKVSMVKEVLLFFNEVLQNDMSLTTFVDSEFTMLNGRLAKHYGIPNVEGLEFHRTPLPPDSHRGGVLTMAAVLKVTANGTTTSPVLRGAWVLDRILGAPPPKPTMDVAAVEPDIRGATTIREQLARHRQNATCASCHVKIDPPGFALENFDVIGGWREHYRSIGEGTPAIVNGRKMRYLYGPPVDAADVLPDGRRFANIDEYKQLLLDDRDGLARALTKKLLTYATGVAPTAGDQPEIERIVARIRDKNYGLRTLVHEVVQSEIFRIK